MPFPRAARTRPPEWYAGIPWTSTAPGQWDALLAHEHDAACEDGCPHPDGVVRLCVWGSPTGRKVPAFGAPWHWSAVYEAGAHVVRGGPQQLRDGAMHHARLALVTIARETDKAARLAATLLAAVMPQPPVIQRDPSCVPPSRSGKRKHEASQAIARSDRRRKA